MLQTRLAVLLVDAQPLERRALQRFIETEDLPYDVVGVGSLADAATQLARRTFDVAIVDQLLDDGAGVDLLPSLPGTPALILLRPGDESLANHAAQAGAYGVVVRDTGRRYLRLLPPVVGAALTRRRAEVEAAARAAESARTRDEFQRIVTMMWHEVVGPLTTLSSTLEMMQIDAESDPTSVPSDMLAMIGQGVEITTYLERLVTDVLGFYRLATPPRLVSVDLDTLVAEAIASLPVAAWHDAVIDKDTLPAAIGDPTRLRLLFRQLLANAQTLRGSNPPVIHIAATEYDDTVRVTVADNGVGIALDEGPLDDLADGIGLGMAVCKRIVEQHGGRMWFESGRQNGTTVHLTLPKAAARARAAGL